MGIGLPVEGEGWCRTAIGEDGLPHGVVGVRLATWVKWGRDCRPVPPITAMVMGSGGRLVRVLSPSSLQEWRGVCCGVVVRHEYAKGVV